MKIEFTPIGIIHSPFVRLEDMPIQPSGAVGIEGTAEVFEEYRAGLRDLDGFSHLILLYHFHHVRSFELQVVPFLDTVPHGIFATRAPKRPNAIGLSIVQLDKIEDGVLYLRNLDISDGTPLLDIKPYVPAFDEQREVRSGWLEKSGEAVTKKKSDNRFTER
jgi:tRNA-Thr(GGU) m(6)t(6)A37 methyltransferase TsaA